MAKISIKAGTTSKLIDIFVQDSSSTTGAGLTGLVYNTASLVAYYYREGAASSTAITLATMTLGTWATGGFVVVDGTNMPGCYQLGIPDTAIAAGAKSVIVMLKGATNMAPLVLEIELTAVDNQSATAFITGVNSLAPPANWNLHSIDSNGRVDVIKLAGTTQTARDIGASVLLSSGVGAGQLDFTSGVVKANATQFAGQTITAAAGVTMPATVASTTNITAGTITTVTNLTNAPTVGDLTAAMKASVTTAATAATPIAASVTGAVGSVTGLTASDVAAIKAKTDSLTFTAAGKVDANMLAVSGSTTAADNLKGGGLGLVVSTCAAGSTTTSIVTNLTEATNDHYNGRVITFTSGALLGQTTSISGYNGTTKTLTVVALTEAPAGTDGFVIS